jgi:hypothetical protein
MAERRRSKRVEVREWARLVFEDGRPALNCVLLDISDIGAGLKVGTVDLPEKFFLYRKKDSSLREVTIARRGATSVGVLLGPVVDPQSELALRLFRALHAVV